MEYESHSFSTGLAKLIGIKEAIILQHLSFMQKLTVKQNGDWRENWVKRSAKSMTETYQYMTQREIKGATDRLFEAGYISIKQENDFSIDRTKSFLITKKGLELLGNSHLTKSKMDDTKGQIPFDEMSNAKRDNTIYYPLRIKNSADAEKAKNAILENYTIKESFTMSRKVPQSRFDESLNAWLLEIQSRETLYANYSDLSGHFLNFSAKRYQCEKEQAARAAKNPTRPETVNPNIPRYI